MLQKNLTCPALFIGALLITSCTLISDFGRFDVEGDAVPTDGGSGDAGGGRDDGGPGGDGGPGDDGGSGGTTLPVDCRLPGSADPACQRPVTLSPGAIGEGPSLRSLPGLSPAKVHQGFVHDGKLVAGVQYGDRQGLVMEFDLSDGRRRVISGTYADPTMGEQPVGAGPALRAVLDIERGPDGTLYAYSNSGTASGEREIVTIDPATGDRTIVWNGSVLCANEQWPAYQSMALGDDGSFYLSLQGSPGGTGSGIMRIMASGGACEVVTLSGANDETINVGGGIPLSGTAIYRSLIFAEGDLYGLEFGTQSLLRVALDGARTRVSSSSGSTPVGAGPDIGTTGVTFHEGAFYTVSDGQTGGFLRIDPATGDRTEVPVDGPARFYPSAVWSHPSNPAYLVAVVDGMAIVLVELATGNSNTISF